MIACLIVPYFSAAVEQRADSGLAQTPLVIGGQPWEPRPVYAFSREAAQGGVRSGMSLRLAHLLAPNSHFMPARPARYLDASGEVVDVLLDFSPAIEPEELWQPENGQAIPYLPARYTLDLDGLPPAEALPLVQEMGRTVRQQTTLAPAIGLAANQFTAQVAAALARPNHTRTITPGDEATFLADQPVHFLPLNKEVARRLRLLGIRTLGQLAALPAAQLPLQFGPDIITWWRWAQGDATDPLRPIPAERQETVVYRFDGEVSHRPVLEAVLNRIAATFAKRLEAAGLAGQTLQLTWEMDHGQQEQAITLREPAQQRAVFYEAMRGRLDQANDMVGITGIRASLSRLSPALAKQLALFGPSTANHEVEGWQRLMAKYPGTTGAGYFYRPVLADQQHPLPERRFQLLELAAA